MKCPIRFPKNRGYRGTEWRHCQGEATHKVFSPCPLAIDGRPIDQTPSGPICEACARRRAAQYRTHTAMVVVPASLAS